MPKTTTPKLDPAFEKAVARMLATPPQPKKAATEKIAKKKTANEASRRSAKR